MDPLAGKIDLIYIDPPFDTGADFAFRTHIGDQEVEKEPSVLEQLAYRDTWGGGTDSYLQMLWDRLTLARDLLSDRGSIYVHLDYRMDSYVRSMMDEIFGAPNYLNEVIWNYVSGGISQRFFARKHDTLLYYSKTGNYTFNAQKERRKDYPKAAVQSDEKGEFVWSEPVNLVETVFARN
jgi:adenine specific DNA methylase Mod